MKTSKLARAVVASLIAVAILACGATTSQLEADSTQQANFAAYAAQVAEGRTYEPPTNYSTLKDLDRDHATFTATLRAFTELFLAITGKTVQAVGDDLDAVLAADKAVAAGEVLA